MASHEIELEFSGAPEIRASRAEVWRRLLDPDFIGRAAPGVEAIERVDDTHFRMILGFGVALFALRFALDVELSDLVARTSARMRAHGHAPGAEVAMVSTIRLEDAAPGVVRLHWTAVSTLSGMVGGLGARLLEGVARKMTAQFWDNFAERVAAGDAGAE